MATIQSTIVTTVTKTVARFLEPLAARLTNLEHIIAELTPVTQEQAERIVHLEKTMPAPHKKAKATTSQVTPPSSQPEPPHLTCLPGLQRPTHLPQD
ncbi:hypothetical protein HPB48_013971 [Haemaphysalis longicornis]|uniref:Uncharacterized protein n=1 Tax=Haemaphysalis longicornis TaxID=44386 RepID=A0A9J6G5F4_HAELO|nr:hypothetical protein HPB48_013971 [Haemaphysalis longicornis]